MSVVKWDKEEDNEKTEKLVLTRGSSEVHSKGIEELVQNGEFEKFSGIL